jgi:hypothetical protein
MTKYIFAFIITFWAVMTFIYIKNEVLPSLPAHSQPSYETLLKNKTVSSKSTMGIFFGGGRIGFTTTKIEPIDMGAYRISNITRIRLPHIPLGSDIDMKGHTIINAKYRLDSFAFKITSSVINYEVKGNVEGNDIAIEIFDGKETKTHKVKNIPEATLSNGFSPFLSMPNLTVGKEWTIHLFNPLSGEVEKARAFVEEKSVFELNDKTYDVYEVVIDYKGFKPRALITPDGVILKEELVIPGLYFIKE